MSRRGASLIKRWSVNIGHKTTVTLEREFWDGVKEIAAAQKLSLDELVTLINRDRQHTNLSSAVRLFVLDYYRRLAEERAGGDVKAK